jgi:DNA-binding PadR family transcriptional regulator
MRKLSELEGVCLGIVKKFQPCTAYRVRRILKQSPSSAWRASAGSVYPLLSRLEAGNHISGETDENDGRGTKFLNITTPGRKALKEWITAGSEPEMVAAISDPVRTRMFFLDTLSERQRDLYLDKLITQMEKYLKKTTHRLNTSQDEDDIYGILGSQGAVLATRARLDWLKLVRKTLTRQ